MNELRQQLAEKRLILHNLIQEIRVLELQVLEEEWKNKPECSYTENEVGKNFCPYGTTCRGIVYCHNINCHK